MKLKIKYVVLALALSVAGCAAYFSIWGLSQLFAGASTAVIIMASVLEVGKIVTTTALHNYWNKLAKALRIYLTISVVVLMLITSAGIYGFLSNAYQSTANKLEIHEGEIGVLDAKKSTFQKNSDDNQKIIEGKMKRLEQLSNLRGNQETRLDNSFSNRAKTNVRGDINMSNSEIQKLNNEIDGLNAKNLVLADSINAYNVKAITLKSGSEITAEVGPLKYIAELTGISMAKVVNYLILLLIFVFDPLAIALILITNRIFQIESNEEPVVVVEEPVESDDTEDVDISPIEDEEELIELPAEEPDEEELIELPAEEPDVGEPIVEESVIPKTKIELEDIKEVKERNRGFSVEIPNSMKNNTIERLGKNYRIRR